MVLLGGASAVLLLIFAGIGVVPTFQKWNSVDPFVVTSDDLGDEEIEVFDGVPPVGAAIQLPREWALASDSDADSGLSASDEYMTIRVHKVDTLAEGASTTAAQVLTRSHREANEIDAPVPAQRAEYTTKGHRVVQIRVQTDDGSTVAAECSIADKAWNAYKRACALILDTFFVYDLGGTYLPHLFYADIAQSNIWRKTPPAFLAGTWEYLTANWKDYDPWQPHPVKGDALSAAVGAAGDKVLLSSEVVALGNTAGGTPFSFSGIVGSLDRMENYQDGRTRWVMQVTSKLVNDWRFYVQFNGPSDFSAQEGDGVFVFNGLAVAAGEFPTTKGYIDNGMYFLAQDVMVTPPFE